MSYKGNIMCSVVNLYKRGKNTADIPEGTFDVGYFDYYVGEFEKVVPDLSAYSVLYYGDDVEQKHPIYRLNNLTDKKLEIDLGGENISTLFINDDKYVNMSDGQTYSDKVIGIGFYPEENQNFGYNFKNYSDNATGAVPVNDRYNKYKSGASEKTYFDVTCSSLYRIKKNYEEYFINGDIDGLTAYYKPDLDYMIAPGFDPNTQMVEYYDQNVNTVYMKSFFRGLYSNYPNSLIGSGFSSSRYMPAYGQFQILNDKGEYTTFYPPIFCDPAIPLRYIAGNATVDSRFYVKTIPFFLKDKKGEYWLMYTIYGAVYGDRNLYPDGGYRDVVLMKIKDMPTTFINAAQTIDTVNTSPLTWITSEEYADPKTIDAFLDVVFSVPKSPNYNDGGPDADGPGDPYDDIGNAGDAIGGNSNIVDELDVNDKTPNTGMTQYLVSGGLYGAYLLTPNNLQQYAGTLNMLYKHSSGLVLGPIYEQYANRITKNSTSLIMLPYNVWSGDNNVVISQQFVVGNSLIANNYQTDDDWTTYLNGSNSATALRITREWSHFETDLGYLDHYYDNFLDFAPYATASLYLPYIGTVPLPLNLIQSTSEERKHLTLTWNISNLTGDIVCMLNVNDMTIMYWTGNCARTIPLSIDNNGAFLRECSQQIIGSILNVVK